MYIDEIQEKYCDVSCDIATKGCVNTYDIAFTVLRVVNIFYYL